MNPASLPRIPSNRLSIRVAVPVGVFALISVVLLSFVLIRQQREQVLREVVQASENTAEAILLSLDHDMRINRREGVESLIGALGRHADIQTIRIFNKDGEIAYSSNPREVGNTVDREAEACVQCHAKGKRPPKQLNSANRARIYKDAQGRSVLATIHVIPNRVDCTKSGCHEPTSKQSVLGILDIAMSLEDAQQRLAVSTRNAVVISLLAAALITAILFALIVFSLRNAALEKEIEQEAEELREAQFQILQAEKLSSVGLVAAGIAHELNSPLMAIVTFAHLVRSSVEKDSQADQDLRMIEREANRCAGIIRQLLDYSRKQQQSPEVQPCSVRQVVDGALNLLKVELHNSEVDVDVQVLDDLPKIDANPPQLMQVFVNLLMNAVQAMPHGGRILVRADTVERVLLDHLDLPPHPSDHLMRITVRDTGTGVKKDNLVRVFDPFFTTKPVGKGSGLGLSVSLGLVRGYRGTILVDSDGRSWTEFNVIIPVSEKPALVATV